MAQGLSCSKAREIFLDQGSNLCPPHWQADSYPLDHHGSPKHILSTFIFVKKCTARAPKVTESWTVDRLQPRFVWLGVRAF